MRYQVSRISVHQSAKVIAIIYFFISLVFIPVFWFVSYLNPTEDMPLMLTLLIPFLYAAAAYVFTALGFIVYNLLAARVGGIEMTLTAEGELPG